MTLLSQDGEVLALLCTRMALARVTEENKPLTTREWTEIARKLQLSDWKRPAALLERSTAEIEAELQVDAVTAARIEQLLARAGAFAIELEQIESRGLWLLTRADSRYPAHLKSALGSRAPAVIFGAGPLDGLNAGGVAVVGSRDADEASLAFATRLGQRCATAGVPLISGAARGVDRTAMNGALEEGGHCVGVIAENLERTIREPETRALIEQERLTLLNTEHYAAHFSIGGAMSRNKVLYALADYAVVVSAAEGTGGTWAGAQENLKARWTPMFVRSAAGTPPGNIKLIESGSLPLSDEELGNDLLDRMQQRASNWRTEEKGSAPQPAEAQQTSFGWD